ncbi:hypothetical protein [Vagococcus fluvialis]|uniref:hypothetical protein n=1 Tax=Vagococcus fluvialis TaxID=2738 RepID=UPI0022DEE8A9|nr:hypothetical protein [Vagococcus fluvialis]
MNSKEKKILFQDRQSNQKFHPLTCGNDSNHKELKLCVSGHFLFCADCDYEQPLKPNFFDELKNLLD